jgi:L-fucose mutarotase
MLIGINVLLRGPLLAALDVLGHGDVLVIADANFPAARLGAALALPGVRSAEAVDAILSVFPLDPDESVVLMAAPDGPQPVQDEIMAAVKDRAAGPAVEHVGRFEFYELARSASLIVQTGELRPYGNVLVRKGGING